VSARRDDERLGEEEFARGLARIRAHFESPSAGEETRELAAWFLRRYPTVEERCAYVTRKMRELERSSPGAGGRSR